MSNAARPRQQSYAAITKVLSLRLKAMIDLLTNTSNHVFALYLYVIATRMSKRLPLTTIDFTETHPCLAVKAYELLSLNRVKIVGRSFYIYPWK